MIRILLWLAVLFFLLAGLRALMETASRHARGERDIGGTPSDRKKRALSVLGLREGASREEIKRAFKQRAAKYHPDRVAHLGPELEELTSEKFKEIQDAYDYLMQSN